MSSLHLFETTKITPATIPPIDQKLFLVQFGVALGMFVTVLLFTIVPYFIIDKFNRQGMLSNSRTSSSRHCLVISIGRLSCFAGGVFISTGFLDLFADVQKGLDLAGKNLRFPKTYPLAEFFTLFGFFLILTIEQVILISKERDLKDKSRLPSRSPSVNSNQHPHPHHPARAQTPSLVGNSSASVFSPFEDTVTTSGTEQSPLSRPEHPTRFTDCQEADNCMSQECTEHYLEGISNIPVLHTENDDSRDGQLVSVGGRGQGYRRFHSLQERNRNEIFNNAREYQVIQHNSPAVPKSDDSSSDSESLGSNESDDDSHKELVHSHFNDLPQHGSLRTVVLILAICIHAVFEGLALGLTRKMQELVTILVALLLHKGIIAAGVGLNLATSTFPRWLCRVICVAFSAASPLGMIIGIIIDWMSNTQTLNSETLLITGCLQGIACGTFFYIVFFEILPHEFNTGVDRMGKLLSLCAGYALVAVYLLFIPNED